MIRTSSLRSSSDTDPIAPWQAICRFCYARRMRGHCSTLRRSALVSRIEHNLRTGWVISDGGRGFSPSGTFEQDDMGQLAGMHAYRGVVSRLVPMNNQMGLGHEPFDPALGAWASNAGF